jgi:hypothetical protein
VALALEPTVVRQLGMAGPVASKSQMTCVIDAGELAMNIGEADHTEKYSAGRRRMTESRHQQLKLQLRSGKLKPTPISEAKRIGETTGATRVAVLIVNDDGNFAVTTWGKTKAQCDALKRWSHTHGDAVLMEMFEET